MLWFWTMHTKYLFLKTTKLKRDINDYFKEGISCNFKSKLCDLIYYFLQQIKKSSTKFQNALYKMAAKQSTFNLEVYSIKI